MTPGRARVGISLFFFTNGALFSTLLPRLPEIKASFALDDAVYGLVVAAVALGALAASALPAVLIRRFGPLAVAAVGTLALAVAMTVAGFAPNVGVFIVCLFLAGAADSCTDVAQNLHGLRVQVAYGRSIFNSLHALWSAGATVGGLTGAAAAAARVPLGWHLAANAVLCVGLAALALWLSRLPPAPATAEPRVAEHDGVAPAAPQRPWGLLAALALLAVAGTAVEDIANNWNALYLHDVAGMPVASSGVGFVAFICAHFAGRIIGDRLTDWFGAQRVAAVGGAGVVAGMGLVVAVPVVPAVLAGYILAGLGAATLVPAAYAATEGLHGFKAGSAMTIIGWFLRVGFLIISPAVGALSSLVGLRWAMLVPVVAGAVACAISLWWDRRSRLTARHSETQRGDARDA